MDKMLMQGKVAMVTGGGRGIGEASAAVWRTSARRSFWPIWILALHGCGRDLKAEGKEAAAIEFNVADFDHITEKVAAARAIYGRIDVLVNVAGITRLHPHHRHHPRELGPHDGHRPQEPVLRVAGRV